MEKTNVCGHEQEHSVAVQRAKARILGAAESDRICAIFRVLADQTRVKIVLGLLEGDMCVYHLTELCGGTQSGVSHQLRVLRDNNIVKAKRIGQTVEYSLADEHVRKLLEISIEHLGCEGE